MFSIKDFRFGYDTYQDVRHNLFLYSVPFLFAISTFAYWMILPPDIRLDVDAVFSSTAFSSVLKGCAGLALSAAIAFLLTEILQVHDRWYDRFVTRWRYYYAIDFMLPRLLAPFSGATGQRIHNVAAENLGDFLERLFYPFVRDRDGLVSKNVVVRFYEVVTIYWLTQINEIAILFLIAMVAVFHSFGPATSDYRNSLLVAMLILNASFALNRIWSSFALARVRRATAEEIAEITRDHLPDLQNRVRVLCGDYGIRFDGIPGIILP